MQQHASDCGGEDRLATLDGLRAVAALMVFLHHAGLLVGFHLLLSGYLAVDFFFMLSGFVMARAYDHRLRGELSAAGMMRARLARLYPTIAIGIWVGAALAMASGMPFGTVLLLVAAQMLFIPNIVPGSMGGVYSLNGVQWSLLFELVANAVHATVLHRLPTRMLAWIVALSIVPLTFAVMAYGSLAIGDKGINFWGGCARIWFPYLCGVLLHRLAAAKRLPIAGFHGGWWMAILVAAMLMPNMTGMSGWSDLAIVILAFPLILGAGASARMGRRWAWLSKLGGRYSYPFYVAQLPAIGLIQLLARPLGLQHGLLSLVLGCLAAIVITIAIERLAFRLSRRRRPSSGRPVLPEHAAPATR